jgi:hypothetical protein
LSDKIVYYKGVNKVKVVTESEGYWIIEAIEDFPDYVDGQEVIVKVGERRMVEPNTVSNKMVLLPPVQEHTYERKMEKKLQQLIEKIDEKGQSTAK